MPSGLRRPFVRVLLVGLAAAVPVAISATWGWLVALPAAVAGAWLVTIDIRRRFVDPVERLAAIARPYAPSPDLPVDELARLIAFSYADAIGRLDEALAEGRRREVALSHAADGIVLIDADGLVDHANPAARSLLAQRVLQLSHRLAEPQLDRLVRQARELDAPVAEEITLRMPAARHVLGRAIPLTGGGAVLVLQDLSEAHRLDRLRRDFVANVSHELKTPVAGMRALAEVAVTAIEDDDHTTARRFVERLEAEGQRLSGLVADLLDLSRVESKEGMDIQAVDVRQLIDEAAAVLRAAAEAKGICIELAGPHLLVDGDRSQLSTAMQNLLENAIRYSERGTIRAAVAGTDGLVAIAVSDEGIGIPADELPRIFERFYRVDRARSRATGGTGLGLSIVRHVAENHGGHVDVSSELGVGSTFTLLIPAPAERGSAA
jgi:two-component system sensor histidine kinase SenX3